MKRVLLVLMCLAFAKAEYLQAQQPVDPNLHLNKPLLHRIDYGFKNPVIKMEEVHYEADDKKIEPTMFRVMVFSDFGNVEQDYRRILGTYGSETLKQYTYKDGLLDSLNTTASAQSFNAKSTFITNQRGHILEETSTGTYTNYNRVFKYDTADNITQIVHTHETGNTITATYFYKDYDLDYVKQTNESGTGSKETTWVYYHDREPLSSFKENDTLLYIHKTNFGKFAIHVQPKNGKNEALEWRQLILNDKTNFDNKVRKVYDTGILIEQVMDATNERGDWFKRYSVTNPLQFTSTQQMHKRYVFRRLTYRDGSTSGSTDFDTFFQMRVPRRAN